MREASHPSHFWPYLLRPARGNAAGVVVVFAVLMTIAANAGLLGIPLALIINSWFFKYAYILFDHTVRGFPEPPPLDSHMVNPVGEQRPVVQVAVLAVLAALVYFVHQSLGTTAAAVLGTLLLLALPASIAVLGLENNPIKALWPLAWLQIIAGLGIWYGLVLGLIAVIAVLVAMLSAWVPFLLLQFLLGMYGILAVFSVLGGALYERRDELGIETWHSPERTAAREQAARHRDDLETVARAYAQVRIGAHGEAWKILQDWLSGRGDEPEDYRWLTAQVTPWPDPRYATRMAQETIARLLVLKRNGEALDLVRECLAADPDFRPKTAAETLALARLADRGGVKPVARRLVADFAQRYPGAVGTELAAQLARELAP
jgi:hypothetical protein